MRHRYRWILALAVIVGPSVKLFAQQAVEDPSRLTVDRIFAAHEFGGEGFGAEWLPDSRGYTMMAPSTEPGGGRDLVKVDAETGKTEILVPASRFVPAGGSPLNVEKAVLSSDRSKLLIYTNSKRVWRTNDRGDYWVLDRTSRELRKLGGDAPASSLMHAKFSPDATKVAYARENHLYVEDLNERTIIKLTNSTSPDETNGTFDWVYEEEFSLHDGFRWSPDGTSIAYWQINSQGVRAFPLVNNADGLYPKVNWIKYPKVGEKNPSCRVGVVSATGGSTRWLAVPGDPRDNYIASMEWVADKGQQYLVLQQLNRLQNTVNVILVNPSGALSTILTEKDDAWVDLQPTIRWVQNGSHFLWLSERDGWRRIYLYSLGKSFEPISPEKLDVLDISGVDEEGGWVYFHATTDNTTRQYLYRAKLDGSSKSPERLSAANQAGTHDDQISPDGRWSIHRYSNFDTPPVTDLVRLPSGERARVLAGNDALKKKLDTLKKRPVEFLKVPIADNLKVDAWRILPPNFDPSKKYPLLVHVYGEPAGRTVVDEWTGANTLWHWMLAQHGYVVMSFDNRGTPSPLGRSWRKSVYRKIGIIAPEDQAAAVRAVLKENSYLDPKRVGTWGWSGGGSMSLNAIFKFPDLYSTAIAIAPVANQRYYDTIYQERYMGLPGDNVEGFVKGSPITYANQLKGKLLLIHGTGDDNCHYQTTEALIDELIRNDKPFTMMAYPNRTHAINEGANTTRHLRSLMIRYLLENLPPGG